MKNILQAIKSCLNGLRVYVDKTVTPLEDAAYANSDWDQNDETAVDYIKNRPFYKLPDVIGATVLEECTLDFHQTEDWNSSYTLYSCDIVDFPLAEHPEISEDTFDSSFKIVWDGEEYYCIGKEDGTEFYCLGNTHYTSNRCENTGEPFLIMFDIWFGTQTVYILTDSAESSHSIEIYALIEQGEIHRIPLKYIPEHEHHGVTPIVEGGTGATTMHDARRNLGFISEAIRYLSSGSNYGMRFTKVESKAGLIPNAIYFLEYRIDSSVPFTTNRIYFYNSWTEYVVLAYRVTFDSNCTYMFFYDGAKLWPICVPQAE